MNKREQDLKKVNKLFKKLADLGFDNRGDVLKRDALYFEYKKSPRLTKANQVVFARLIRSCTLMEKEGILVADINRMGDVIGWHVRPKEAIPCSKCDEAKLRVINGQIFKLNSDGPAGT